MLHKLTYIASVNVGQGSDLDLLLLYFDIVESPMNHPGGQD